jgi:hypothetical protein
MTMHPLFKLRELLSIKAPSAALVSVGGIAEAVTDDPVTAFECRFDHLCEVLSARSEHQQGFCFEMHGLVQQQFAELLAKRCATWFAGGHHLQPWSRTKAAAAAI